MTKHPHFHKSNIWLIQGLLILNMLLASFLQAQQPLNLDFEQPSIEGITRPWGWSIDLDAPNITVAMDSIHKHSKKYSLSINGKSKKGELQNQSLSFGLEPHALKNKKIHV